MKRYLFLSEKGFTLIEILIYSIISSILLVALFGALFQTMHSYRMSEQSLYSIKNSRKAFDTLISELRTSSSIVPSTQRVTYFYNDGNPDTVDVSSAIYLGTDGLIYHQSNVSDTSSAIAITNISASNFAVTPLSSGVYNLSISFTNGIFNNTKIKKLNN
jgi:type II secretory pathway pseudopilin PulG